MPNRDRVPVETILSAESLPASGSEQASAVGFKPPCVAVLIVGQASCGLALSQAALPDGNHGYEVLNLGLDPSVSAVAHLLESAPPALMVVDIRWCEAAGPAALRRLRKLSPITAWMVCWPQPETQWFPLLLDCGALGALTFDATPQERLQALNAVRAGELWLPRKVLQWLYAQLLHSGFASPQSGDSAARLTKREAEAMNLTQQGLSNRVIGERLGVSVNTVKKHLANGFEKLGIHKRRQLLG